MFGYATNETKEFMPLSHQLSTSLCQCLSKVRRAGTLPWLRPDAKTQVTVEYKNEGKEIVPVRVHTIVISTQHDSQVDLETIKKGKIKKFNEKN